MKLIQTLQYSLLASSILYSGSALAENLFSDWEISATNTARYENVNNHGNLAASPYSFSGSHMYDEFDVNISRQFSPYTRVRGQIFGLVNGSDYRHPDDGLVPERMSFQLETGDTAIPLRLDAGDYFANISYRTLQRSLKGAQIELQPNIDLFGAKHSFLAFSGANQPFWRHFDADEDRYDGASWLMAGNWGQLSFNSVHNEYNALSGFSSQSQWVHSAAYEKSMTLGTERLNLETEIAYFSGDYGTGATMRDENDAAFFAELNGRSTHFKPLDYILRYDNNGADYQPRGGILTPNRESREAFIGWRFDNGLYLQGRGQLFEDAAHRGDEQDTQIWGAHLTGPLLGRYAQDVSGSINAYTQDIDTQSRSINMSIDVVDFTIAKPLSERWNGELMGLYQSRNDHTATNNDQSIRQAGFRLTHNYNWNGFNGSVSPGFLLRSINTPTTDTIELHPTLDLNLYKDSHALNASYGWFNQNHIVSTIPVTDVLTQTAGINYSYRWNIHEVGLEGFWFDRSVEQLQDTETARIGVYWTVNLYKPAGSSTIEPQVDYYDKGNQVSPPSLFGGDALYSTRLIAGLQLGQPLKPQLTSEAMASYGQPITTGRASIYDVTMLDGFNQRQRLALIKDGWGKLSKTALVIDANNDGRPERLAQTYARLRDALIKRYGQPTSVYEDGNFSNQLAANLQAGTFIRTVEWHSAHSTIRFGIPRRVDGQIRFEVQEAKSFSSPRNPNWGVTFR